jgi:hypothetical protein
VKSCRITGNHLPFEPQKRNTATIYALSVARYIMVSMLVSKKSRIPSGAFVFLGITAASAVVTFFTSSSPLFTSYVNLANPQTSISVEGNNFDYEENSKNVKILRQLLLSQCTNATSPDDLIPIPNNQISGYITPTDFVPTVHDKVNVVRRCKNVVMDFGANIGDTSGHVLDAGMIRCDRTKDLGSTALRPHFNVETKKFEIVKNLNKLSDHLRHLMTKHKPDQGPEDYCYYGIEGNPHFTNQLHSLENFVMAMRPRPIQHMHFFTESVGAGEDGMTKLYLDTVNSKHNFWGSSIFKDHQDVRKSANGLDVETIAAPVMGYTLGTLMQSTLAAFDPNAPEQDKSGGHFILKVDIEGGEYPLLQRAVTDGTLCEFVKLGNTADIFIEFHSQKVTGKHDYAGKKKEMNDALANCGVTMGILGANWA